jgi:predicted nucleic acid-binding protein
MLVVDTTVWVDYFNGQINPETDYLDQALSEELVLVGDLILAEILQGFRSDNDFQQAQAALAKFEQVEMVNLQRAQQSAQNYRTLRKMGVTVRKTIDCLIATFCIAENHILLHRDADFDAFEQHLGLQVVHAGNK